MLRTRHRPMPVARCLTLLVAILGLAPTPLALADAAAPAASGGPIDARIEIVWPHDRRGNQAPVGSAPLVNVEVYLFRRGTLDPVGCDFSAPVLLRWARAGASVVGGAPSGALLPVGDATAGDANATEATGQRVARTVDGKAFPVWVFNDVPVATTEIGLVTTYFLVEVPGADYRTSVWAHGVDPRAFLPSPQPPQAVGGATPDAVDGLIQIVFPHDAQGRQQPVARAPLVNVAVDLAQPPSDPAHSRWNSVGAGFDHAVRLLRSLNSGYLDPVKAADAVTAQTFQYQTGASVTWPRWQFDDVDVSAAQDPLNKYYFAVQVDGVPTHTTIWAHGADPRTYFPRRDVPTSGGAGCS